MSRQDNASIWFTNDDRDKEYHLKQFKKIYRSTEVFVDWLDDNIKNSHAICDMACGCGANTVYMANRYPGIDFVGIDFNPNEVNIGKSLIEEGRLCNNVTLKVGDLYNVKSEDVGVYDGVISFQTLSWLPSYQEEIKSLANLDADWIAISSLFFDGNIDFSIKIKEYDRIDVDKPRESYYNVYSLNRVKAEFEKYGYSKFEYKKFEIDIDRDIPQSHPHNMGTYTVKTESGERLQISGALLMPWYFVLAKR